ncbi:PDZ/DHR/GLGF domain containing protein [Bifidobacterium biavatii DSM 23969]|uniref:endopeptidase La n=2 Tax=Bifidobacterium biavatii TaxID=762212 RepID=A0A086ZWG3_9BIFI|nr:S16 family serine protease [Bifidobacterium biavatii]KFI50863.1 PDZ/DHR/GLGF domain containing protein [Bifidobacterium biavatii DSM 23969]
MHQKRQSQAEGIFDADAAQAEPDGVPDATESDAADMSDDARDGAAASSSSSPSSRHGLLRRIAGVPGAIGAWLEPYRGLNPKYFTGMVAVLLSVIVMCLPSAYAVESPGPTADVLGKTGGKQVIAVTGAKTHQDKGKLLLVTVNASGVPGYPVTNAQTLYAWIDPHQTVMPQEAVVPVGQTAEEYKKESSKEMSSSQDTATAAALAYAKKLGVDTDGVKVTMHVDDIGGPSAGMMYALGLIDKLTPDNETGGKTIAGTGTMSKNGKVGAIGGIRLKMLGAKRDGATWFLAPESNCSEVVGHVPSGLRDVKVATLDEAYRALVAIGKGEGETLAHCTAK